MPRRLLCLAILLLPALAVAADVSPVLNGHALLKMSPASFRAYVSGIYEGQVLLAAALRVPPVICVGATVKWIELANLVKAGLLRLPKEFLNPPAWRCSGCCWRPCCARRLGGRGDERIQDGGDKTWKTSQLLSVNCKNPWKFCRVR